MAYINQFLFENDDRTFQTNPSLCIQSIRGQICYCWVRHKVKCVWWKNQSNYPHPSTKVLHQCFLKYFKRSPFKPWEWSASKFSLRYQIMLYKTKRWHELGTWLHKMNVINTFNNFSLLYNKCIEATIENLNFDINLEFKG